LTVVRGEKCDLLVRRRGKDVDQSWLFSSRRKALTLLAQRDCSFLGTSDQVNRS